MFYDCEKLQLRIVKTLRERMKKDNIPCKNIILIAATGQQAKNWKRELAEELEVLQKDLYLITSNPDTQDGMYWRDSIVLLIGRWWENPSITQETLTNIRKSAITRQVVL